MFSRYPVSIHRASKIGSKLHNDPPSTHSFMPNLSAPRNKRSTTVNPPRVPRSPTPQDQAHLQRRLLLSVPTGDLKLSLPCTLRTRERCSRSCCSSFLTACDPPGCGKCRMSCGELSSTTTLSPESRFAVRLRRCCRFDRRWVNVVSIGRVVVGGVVSVRVSARSC